MFSLLLSAALAQAGTIATVECYSEAGEQYVIYHTEHKCSVGPNDEIGYVEAEARYSAHPTNFDIWVLGEARPGYRNGGGISVVTGGFSEVIMNYQVATAGPPRPGFLELAIGGGAF